MEGRVITAKMIAGFREHLILEERSVATIQKYIRDIKAFMAYAQNSAISKETVIAYKKYLQENYAVRSVNSMLASINSFFSLFGWNDLKVKSLKLQQQVFCPEERELTKAEYTRLCRTAERKHNKRLNLILQTICGTGIRVSELQFITVEAAKCGEAVVRCKGKTRAVFIVRELRQKLLRYAAEQNIEWNDFRDPHGQTHQPHEYLAGDESVVRRGRCQPAKGVPAQPAPPVRPCVLWNRKGHCKAGRHPRSLKY